MKHAVLSIFAAFVAATLTTGCSTTSFNQGFATVQNGFKTVEISAAPSLKGKATFTDLRFEAPYTIKGSITYPRSCAVLTVEGRLYDEKNKSYAFTKGIMDYRKDDRQYDQCGRRTSGDCARPVAATGWCSRTGRYRRRLVLWELPLSENRRIRSRSACCGNQEF